MNGSELLRIFLFAAWPAGLLVCGALLMRRRLANATSLFVGIGCAGLVVISSVLSLASAHEDILFRCGMIRSACEALEAPFWRATMFLFLQRDLLWMLAFSMGILWIPVLLRAIRETLFRMEQVALPLYYSDLIPVCCFLAGALLFLLRTPDRLAFFHPAILVGAAAGPIYGIYLVSRRLTQNIPMRAYPLGSVGAFFLTWLVCLGLAFVLMNTAQAIYTFHYLSD